MTFKPQDINQILFDATFDKEISNYGVISRIRPLIKSSDKQLNQCAESAILTSMALKKVEPGFMKALLQKSTADQLQAITEEIAYRS